MIDPFANYQVGVWHAGDVEEELGSMDTPKASMGVFSISARKSADN